MRLLAGEFIVMLRPGASLAAVRGALQSLGGRVKHESAATGVVSARGLSPAAAASLAQRSDVQSVSPDYKVQWLPSPASAVKGRVFAGSRNATTQGTDQHGAEFFSLQWNLQVTKADQAWVPTPAGKGQLVCIVDSGIDPDHVDLVGRVDLSVSKSVITSPDFPGDLTIIDYNYHGTEVSSLIASNGVSMASVAPEARLCAVKVFTADGGSSVADVIAGVDYAVSVGANVINLSLGQYVSILRPGVPQIIAAIQRSIDNAVSKGVFVVAAAGNNAADLDHDPQFMRILPAQSQNVISVGATAPVNHRNFDRLASYSNYGGDTGLDLVAPGGEFAGEDPFDLVITACSQYSTLFYCPGGNYYYLASGTGAAAPHVAAAGAILASVRGPLSPATIKRCLKATADPLTPYAIFGSGRLNVLAASQCTLS
ncbi:MAG: S8 family serine peptidase [Gemmatimonadaceae bacterium]